MKVYSSRRWCPMDSSRKSPYSDNRPPHRVPVAVACALAVLVLLPACSRKAEVRAPASYRTTGQASWYGKKYSGRKTASGEKYDGNQCTAAHRSLPFNTVVRVENLKNGRKVDVRINDRGPFVEGRIIDLSRKAAEKLEMIRDGVVPVRIKVLEGSY